MDILIIQHAADADAKLLWVCRAAQPSDDERTSQRDLKSSSRQIPL